MQGRVRRFAERALAQGRSMHPMHPLHPYGMHGMQGMQGRFGILPRGPSSKPVSLNGLRHINSQVPPGQGAELPASNPNGACKSVQRSARESESETWA